MAAPRKPPPDGRQVQQEREPADRSDAQGGAGHGISEIVPSHADDTDSDYASQRAGCCRDQHLRRPHPGGRRRDEKQRDGRGEREHGRGMPARIGESALIGAVNQGLAQAVVQSGRSRNGRCGKDGAVKPAGEQAGNDDDCAQRSGRKQGTRTGEARREAWMAADPADDRRVDGTIEPVRRGLVCEQHAEYGYEDRATSQ